MRWPAPGVQLAKGGSNIPNGAGGFQVQNDDKYTNKETNKKLNTQVFRFLFIYPDLSSFELSLSRVNHFASIIKPSPTSFPVSLSPSFPPMSL